MPELRNFQSYSYHFPKSAYLIYLKLDLSAAGKYWYHALDYIGTDLQQVTQLYNDYKKFTTKHANHVTFQESTLLYKLKLEYLIPHTKELWSQNTPIYDASTRTVEFQNPLKHYGFYNLLVTPALVYKKQESLSAAIPIPVSTLPEQLPMIMKSLKYPVDHRSTHSAIYSTQSRHYFNPSENIIKPFK